MTHIFAVQPARQVQQLFSADLLSATRVSLPDHKPAIQFLISSSKFAPSVPTWKVLQNSPIPRILRCRKLWKKHLFQEAKVLPLDRLINLKRHSTSNFANCQCQEAPLMANFVLLTQFTPRESLSIPKKGQEEISYMTSDTCNNVCDAA